MTDDELKRLLEANTERIEKRFDALDNRFDAVDKRFDAVDERLDAHDNRFDALDKKIDNSVAELRRHFDVVVEHTDSKFQFLAEAVGALDEKVDRKMSALELRVEQGFEETQAMIKFSHAELDRRLHILEQWQRALEESFASLQARVERLEETKTTH